VTAAAGCWPLAVVLELAERDEAGARDALGAALADEDLLRQEHAAAAGALATERAGLAGAAARAPAPGATAASLVARARHFARLRDETGRLAAALGHRVTALTNASAEVARRRDAVVAARAAVRSLEAHRETWRLARARARERVEEAAVEELVSARARASR